MQLQLVVDNTEAWKQEFNILTDDRINLIMMVDDPQVNPVLRVLAAAAIEPIELRLMFLSYHLFCRK